VLTILEYQETYADHFRDLFERVLAMAALAGLIDPDVLKRVEVKVTMPNPRTRDALSEAQRAEIELRNGTTSPQWEAEQAGREFDKVQRDRKQATAAGWTPPSAGPAPGGSPGEKPGLPAAPPVAESLLEAWSEGDHPRDDHGKFVAGEEMAAAKSDPRKAYQLRQRVTDPGERKKLDAAIGGGNGGHNIALPKSRKKLTIQHAQAALDQMGYKLEPHEYDLANQTARYKLTHPDGKQTIITSEQLKEMVYRGAKESTEDADLDGDLLENFTGTKKDSLGREYHYVDGKRVASRAEVEAAGPDPKAPAGGDPAPAALDADRAGKLQAASADQYKAFSGAEQGALTDYTTGLSVDINADLRAGKEITDRDTLGTLKNMDALLAKVPPFPEPVTVYRGLNFKSADEGEAFVKALEGQKGFTDPGYSSTSLDPSISAGYLKHRTGADAGGSVMLEVQAKHGFYLEGLSAVPGSKGEHEMILPRGSQFRLTGKKQVQIGDKTHTVYQVEQVHGSAKESRAILSFLGALLENFTGTKKDSLGREYHYVDGKRVASRAEVEAAGPDPKAPAGGDPAPHDAPTADHVWAAAAADLPTSASFLAKAKAFTDHAYQAIWTVLAERGMSVAPEILDVAQDYEKIAYAKYTAQGQTAHDPFMQSIGVPYTAVSVVVSKAVGMAYGYFKGKGMAESLAEAMDGRSREDIADAVVELFRQLWKDVPDAPVPTREDVLKRMQERAQ
jgi:hypothetical protein